MRIWERCPLKKLKVVGWWRRARGGGGAGHGGAHERRADAMICVAGVGIGKICAIDFLKRLFAHEDNHESNVEVKNRKKIAHKIENPIWSVFAVQKSVEIRVNVDSKAKARVEFKIARRRGHVQNAPKSRHSH
jgi:hypothetical protein